MERKRAETCVYEGAGDGDGDQAISDGVAITGYTPHRNQETQVRMRIRLDNGHAEDGKRRRDGKRVGDRVVQTVAISIRG